MGMLSVGSSAPAGESPGQRRAIPAAAEGGRPQAGGPRRLPPPSPRTRRRWTLSSCCHGAGWRDLLERGALAATRLGRAARRDAIADAAQASVASFTGALLPLGVAAALPAFPWLPLVLAVGMLTFLGAEIGRRLGGNAGLWAAALAVAGIILIGVGAALNIA